MGWPKSKTWRATCVKTCVKEQTNKKQTTTTMTKNPSLNIASRMLLCIVLWRHIESWSVHSKSLGSFLYELLLSRKTKTTRLDQCIQYSKFNTQRILLCSSKETKPEWISGDLFLWYLPSKPRKIIKCHKLILLPRYVYHANHIGRESSLPTE